MLLLHELLSVLDKIIANVLYRQNLRGPAKRKFERVSTLYCFSEDVKSCDGVPPPVSMFNLHEYQR